MPNPLDQGQRLVLRKLETAFIAAERAGLFDHLAAYCADHDDISHVYDAVSDLRHAAGERPPAPYMNDDAGHLLTALADLLTGYPERELGCSWREAAGRVASELRTQGYDDEHAWDRFIVPGNQNG